MTISSRQLTALVLACTTVLAAALFLRPVPVGASTGDLVNVADPSHSTQIARVTSAGRLVTSACDADSCAGTDGNRLLADARMGVPAKPWNPINDMTLSASDTRRPVYQGLGTLKLNLTSLAVSAEGGTAGSVKLLLIAYVKSNSASGDCEGLSGFGAAERFTVVVPVGDTINITWPTPLRYTAYADSNDFWCFDVESYGGPTGYTAHVLPSGFLAA